MAEIVKLRAAEHARAEARLAAFHPALQDAARLLLELFPAYRVPETAGLKPMPSPGLPSIVAAVAWLERESRVRLKD